MKRLIAENERLKKELTETQKQVETLKGDVTRKDQEIAQLRGQNAGQVAVSHRVQRVILHRAFGQRLVAHEHVAHEHPPAVFRK